MVVRLQDVAAECGVSTATASRALNGSTRVGAATTLRIREAATRLGYRPNASARALRTARSRMVGAVVTNLINSSFQVISVRVQRRLAEAGYHMVLSVTGGDPDRELEALRVLADHNAEGVIVVGSHPRSVEELNRLRMPTVHLARRPTRPTGDCVLVDDLTGAREATTYLAGLGHRRIGVVAGPETITSGRERVQGYRLGLRDAGLPVVDELVVTGPLKPATGAAAVATLLALPAGRRPTALLLGGPEASFGGLPALREAGVDVPGELSVIGYEDSDLLRWWHPAVTVVDIDAAEMGELAAALLLERIRGNDADAAPRPPAELRVGTRLVVRASCAPPSRNP